MATITLTPEFQEILDSLEHSSHNLLITGNAGTGKSTLLDHFRNTTKKAVAVIAPTGVAALNVRGQTIHSFFKFNAHITPEKVSAHAQRFRHNLLYSCLDMIIIDEISMVRADLLDCVDIFLKEIFKSSAPFGGLQMVFFGDLYQLPPVVTSEEQAFFSQYRSPFYFDAHVMQELDIPFKHTELTQIFRQQDPQFIQLLNAIRNASIKPSELLKLNAATIKSPSFHQKDAIFLTTTNAKAEKINTQKLSQLSGKLFVYPAKIKGEFGKQFSPTEESLHLKMGARVMFLTNQSDGLWVNGSVGEIISISDNEIRVKKDDEQIVTVGQHTWEIYRYAADPDTQKLIQERAGSFKQYPLKLAWAITIHKSQGKTFDKVVIDLGIQAFAHGQVYVALSRCKTLDGIRLLRPIQPRDLITDLRVKELCEKEHKFKL